MSNHIWPNLTTREDPFKYSMCMVTESWAHMFGLSRLPGEANSALQKRVSQEHRKLVEGRCYFGLRYPEFWSDEVRKYWTSQGEGKYE